MNLATRSVTVAIVLWLIVPVPVALSAGIQALKVPSDGSWPALSGAVWYPCAIAPTAIKLGPFDISATKDCPITGSKWPLIVISHGRVGTFLDHRDTAQALADAGFVVAAISHPGDNALDSGHSNELAVFVERPADIKRLIDHLLGSWSYAAAIDPDRIGLFGFSRGGYAGLVLAGANPRFGRNEGMCVGQTSTICEDVRQGKVVPLVHDRRVKALVIADPLSVFFTRTSFDEVRVPIQLWRSEHGGDRVTPESVAAVADELPVKPDFRTVPNAQHASFLPPCPDELAASAHDICTEPSDFDRAAFHKEFNGQVLEFFRQALR
ncbi:MAG TPA: dienelactone hydrolase family protein [Burkholderiales bacterium]|nr:dienelactone hydrolase family protein [Burkholderiales bacterium]